MHHPAIKVICFDLDDTLWDVKPVLIHAEQRTYNWLAQHAPKLTAMFSLESFMEFRWQVYKQHPELLHQISNLRSTAVQQGLKKAGYNEAMAHHLAQQAFDIFIDARHQIEFFAHTETLLAQLQPRFSLGVLTNGNADVFRLAIGQFFDFAFSAEQLNSSKPAEDLFVAAQRHKGITAKQIIHIGDNIDHDIFGAQQAGCYSIWFNPQQLPTPDGIVPSEQVRSLVEIPAAIDKIIANL